MAELVESSSALQQGVLGDDVSLYSNESASASQQHTIPSHQGHEPQRSIADSYASKSWYASMPTHTQGETQKTRTESEMKEPLRLNFSVKWSQDVRCFSIPAEQIDSICYQTLLDLFEVGQFSEVSSWPSKRKQRQRRSLLARFSRRPSPAYGLFVEHRLGNVPSTSRPRSKWSPLAPWDDSDGSLQLHLLRDYLRKQAAERNWVMVLVRDHSQDEPTGDTAWTPSGLERLGKGLSRLSWGLGNLLGDTDHALQTKVDREAYLRLGEDDESQGLVSGDAETDRPQVDPFADQPQAQSTSSASRRSSKTPAILKRISSLGKSGTTSKDALAQPHRRGGQLSSRSETQLHSHVKSESQSQSRWELLDSRVKSGHDLALSNLPQTPRKNEGVGRKMLKLLTPAVFRQDRARSSPTDSTATSEETRAAPPRPWLEPVDDDTDEFARQVEGALTSNATTGLPSPPLQRGRLIERMDLTSPPLKRKTIAAKIENDPPAPRQQPPQVRAASGRIVSLTKSSHVHRDWGRNSSLSVENPSWDSSKQVKEAVRLDDEPDDIEPSGSAPQQVVHDTAPSTPTASTPPTPQRHLARTSRSSGNHVHGSNDDRDAAAAASTTTAWPFKIRKIRKSRSTHASLDAAQEKHVQAQGHTRGHAHAIPSSRSEQQLGHGASVVGSPEDARAGMRRAWAEAHTVV